MKTIFALAAFCLLVAGCATAPKPDNALSLATSVSLTVAVPEAVFTDRAKKSFTLQPTVILKNLAETPLEIIFCAGECDNVAVRFDVYDRTGIMQKAPESEPQYTSFGGGRVITRLLHRSETMKWRNRYKDTYAYAETESYRIIAHAHINGRVFDSAPFSFRVEESPNQ